MLVYSQAQKGMYFNVSNSRELIFPILNWHWFWFGFFLWIIAIPVSLLISPTEKAVERRKLQEGYARCPYCAEIIKRKARICRYCGSELVRK